MRIIKDVKDINWNKIIVSLNIAQERYSDNLSFIYYTKRIENIDTYFTIGFDFKRYRKLFKESSNFKSTQEQSFRYDVSSSSIFTVYEMDSLKELKNLLMGLELLK